MSTTTNPEASLAASAGTTPQLKPRKAKAAPRPEKTWRARLASIWSNLFPFIVLAVLWEVIVQLDIFPRILMPSLATVAETGWRLWLSGQLVMHLAASVGRLMAGFLIGSVLGIGLGLLMGNIARVERFFLPLLSALMPIPALAWIPLFVLWFGLGNIATLNVIIFATILPVAFNTWTGVKTVNPVWIRAAESMKCTGLPLFVRVVFPASLAMVFAGLRIGLSQAWRALVAGEMLAATQWGLGFAIFDAREFLATDVMLVMVICIGLTGYLIVAVLFGLIEKHTVVKWGMLKGELGT